MADSISTQCPQCQATLKLKSRLAVGKKATCPKCKQPFVVKLLEEPAEDDDFLGDLESYDEDYGEIAEPSEAEPTPPVAGRRSASKKKAAPKQTGAADWKRPALMAGGGLLGVGLLIGLVWVSVGALWGSGSDHRLDLAYLPPDSELIVSVRVADIWNAPILKSLVDKPEVRKKIGEMREEIGLEPADIESVIFGVSGLSERQKQSAQQKLGPAGGSILPMPDLDGLPGIVVVRTSKVIDKQKLVDYAEKSEEIPIEKIETATHSGKEYYRIPGPGVGSGPEFIGVFFPDDKTIVLGPEEDVKLAIERGSQAKARPDLDFIDLDQHFLIAMVPKDRSAFNKERPMSPGTTSEAAKKLHQTTQEALQGFSFGLTLTEGIDFQLQFDCTDSSQAGKFKTDLQAVLDETLTEGRQKMAEAKKALKQEAESNPNSSPVWGELIGVAEKVIDSIQAEQQSTTVVVTAAVPGSAGSTFTKLPQAISDAWSQGPFGAPNMGGDFTVTNQNSNSPDFDTFPSPTEIDATPKPTPLKSVSLEKYHATWRVDLDIQDQPAGEVLKKLVQELGLTLQTAAAQKTALAKPVTVELSQTSRLEAIEEVCRQIGLSPVYASTNSGFNTGDSKKTTVSLKQGPRSLPVTFAGPFLVETAALKENAPYPTGQLELRVYSPGLAADVLSVVRENRRLITFEEVTDSQQRDLTDTGGGSAGWSQEASPIYDRSYYMPLKNLLRSVTTIKSVRGRMQFRLPTKVKTVRFDKLTAGTNHKIGGIELKIKRANITPNYSSVSFEITGAPKTFQYSDVKFEFADAKGKAMSGLGGGGSGFGGKWNIEASVQGQPASITAKFITEVAALDYPFQLADIPLKSYQQMPVKIVPAKFAGHETPVTLQFVKIVPNAQFPNFPPNVRLRVINHADKKIRRLNMAFEYLNASGKTLKDWSMASYSGKHTIPSKGPVIVVAGNAKTEFDTDAPFMPKETKSVTITLKKVRFVDAEEWTPKKTGTAGKF